jgi:hypothetical protein
MQIELAFVLIRAAEHQTGFRRREAILPFAAPESAFVFREASDARRLCNQ